MEQQLSNVRLASEYFDELLMIDDEHAQLILSQPYEKAKAKLDEYRQFRLAHGVII